MSIRKKEIMFYNAIPMPHSLLLQKKLEEAGYKVNFWYYRNLTDLYPWKELNSNVDYYVFTGRFKDFVLLTKHFVKSKLIVVTGFHTIVHIIISFTSVFSRKKLAIWFDVPEFKEISALNFHKELLKKFFVYTSDYLFVTGKTGCNIFRERFNIKDSKIVDFPYLGHIFTKEETRTYDGQSQGKVRIFISNRFEARKGYKILYEALNVLDQNIKDKFSIRIAGAGSEFEFYKEKFDQLDSDVLLLGWISYDEYLYEMKNTDIFIHASLHEPFGIPPIDAMSCGKLLIGSNGVYSCLDRIENNKNGFIYDKNDYKRLASILEYVIKNPDLIGKMGYSAYLTSLDYTVDYNISAIRDILDKQ